MASDSLQHAKDQAVLDYVEQAVVREGEAIRSKCIAKTENGRCTERVRNLDGSMGVVHKSADGDIVFLHRDDTPNIFHRIKNRNEPGRILRTAKTADETCARVCCLQRPIDLILSLSGNGFGGLIDGAQLT